MATVPIGVKADAAQAAKAFFDLGKEAGSSFDGISARAVAMGNLMSDAVTAGLRMAKDAVVALAGEAREWIELSNVQENAEKALEAALRATGQFTGELADQYKALASEFQAVTAVGDEKLLPLMGQLVSVGGVQRDQMKQVTQAALDLGIGLGKDASLGFELMAKAAAGNTSSLGRYGIQIEKTGDQQKDFEILLDAISQKFGGSAAAAAETFSGRLTDMENRWGDMKETLGLYLKETLEPFVELMSQGVDTVTLFVNAHKAEIIKTFSGFILTAADAMAILVKSGTLVATTYGNLRLVFAELLEALRPVIDTMSALAERIPGMEGFAETLDMLSLGVEQNTRDQAAFAASVDAAASAINGQVEVIRGKLHESLGETSRKAVKTAEDLRGLTGEDLVQGLRELAREQMNAAAAASGLGDSGSDAMARISESAKAAGRSIREHVAEQTKKAATAVKESAGAIKSIWDELQFQFQIGVGGKDELGLGADNPIMQGIQERLKDLRDFGGFVTNFGQLLAAGNVKGARENIQALEAQKVANLQAGGKAGLFAANELTAIISSLTRELATAEAESRRQTADEQRRAREEARSDAETAAGRTADAVAGAVKSAMSGLSISLDGRQVGTVVFDLKARGAFGGTG